MTACDLDTLHDLARVAPDRPPCFPTRDAWMGYLLECIEQARKHRSHSVGPLIQVRGEAAFNPGFDFCADCTEAYREKMAACGRCVPDALKEVQWPSPKPSTPP